MNKQLESDIKKLEYKKERNLKRKSELEQEVTQIDSELRKLYSLKSKLDKAESEIEEYYSLGENSSSGE